MIISISYRLVTYEFRIEGILGLLPDKEERKRAGVLAALDSFDEENAERTLTTVGGDDTSGCRHDDVLEMELLLDFLPNGFDDAVRAAGVGDEDAGIIVGWIFLRQIRDVLFNALEQRTAVLFIGNELSFPHIDGRMDAENLGR